MSEPRQIPADRHELRASDAELKPRSAVRQDGLGSQISEGVKVPTAAETQYLWLRQEIAYLTARCSVLQGEVWDLSGRLAQALQHIELSNRSKGST